MLCPKSTLLSSCILRTCRYVQILAEETDDSICGPPSTSSSSATSTLTTSSVHTSPSSTILVAPTSTLYPSAAPSAAPSSTPTEPPVLPTHSPFPNDTLTIDPLLVQPVQSGSGLTLFIVGILFLILGVSLIVIAAVILLQHRKACALNVLNPEDGKDRRSPYPKLAPTLNDNDTRVSQSSSIDSSVIRDANATVTVSDPPSEDLESKTSEGEEVTHSDNLTQANGHYLHNMPPTDTATAILGSTAPTEEHNIQSLPGTFTFAEELAESSSA